MKRVYMLLRTHHTPAPHVIVSFSLINCSGHAACLARGGRMRDFIGRGVEAFQMIDGESIPRKHCFWYLEQQMQPTPVMVMA